MTEKEIQETNVRSWSLEFVLKSYAHIRPPSNPAGLSLSGSLVGPIDILIEDAKKVEAFLCPRESGKVISLKSAKK